MVCVHKVGSLGVSARLMAVDTIPANAAHEHCVVGVWLGEGATLRCGGVRTHETGVFTTSISGLPPVLGMRGQEKYDAMVRKDRDACTAMARAQRKLTRADARKRIRRGQHPAGATLVTATATRLRNFADRDIEPGPNERALRRVVNGLIESKLFLVCRTLRGRALLLAPRRLEYPLVPTEWSVPLLTLSAPLPLFGGRSRTVCVGVVSRAWADGVPTFALCAGNAASSGEQPEVLALTAERFAAVQRQAASLLGVQLLDESVVG